MTAAYNAALVNDLAPPTVAAVIDTIAGVHFATIVVPPAVKFTPCAV
jgi:hypothetical protein